MMLDFLPRREACGNLREAAEHRQFTEKFRQYLCTFLEKVDKLMTTL